MMTGRISKKQEEILEYLKEQILTKGYPPAVREICEAVNLRSTSSVHAHLETLEKLGYIRRDPTKPRAIEITDESFSMVRRELVNIPIVGQVAAGTPILAEQNIDGYFPLPAEMVPSSGELYMLNVKGDSMINAGILNGDRLIVQHTESARNGEIVVALLDDSATVKRFYKEKGHVRLQPDNDNMEPIIVEQVSVIGKVVGLLRTHMQ
ncbi:transcriptional repressor LexA [Cuneatibacter caecimuris]|uniref:LexA repressor n=1 Tax=Cuneatibacter caecimuris TaxID=1796618 RepID=A0A4Q7NZW5_9FIRM|nr:transcriptional repressor LexA [Cuneatibacter caecimuris]RZS92914.1 SOS-response transcriptional repressor LexA [Cuneatibacter caecimuris]